MDNIRIEMEGVEKVLREAALFNRKIIDDVGKEIKTSSQNIKKNARARVLVKTGRLRKSITVKDTSKKAGFEPRLAKTVHTRSSKGGFFGHIVEGGTSNRSHPIFGTSGSMPVSPFMRPAEEAEAPRFNAALRRVANEHKVI